MSKKEGRNKMSDGDISLPRDYRDLLLEVKARVRAAQHEALKAVNKELVGLCWDIGRIMLCFCNGARMCWRGSFMFA